MSTLRDFIFAALLMMTVGLVIPFLKRKFASRPTQSYEHKSNDKDVGRPLYGLFVAILVLTPAASFMLATELEVPSRNAFVFLFMGIGVLFSLPLTLLLARLISVDQYGKYWRYLEASSKIGRRAILLMWFCVTAMTLGIGVAMFFDGKS